MTAFKSSYIIVCEGVSEYTYLQKLNRFLRANGYSFTFVSKVVGSGHFKEVQKKYRAERRNNHAFPIQIWVDKDTYIRNDAGDKKSYEQKNKTVPDFLFSCMNFEDFLTLHMERDVLEKWYRVCCKVNHHRVPLREKVYLPLLKKHVFPAYQKGDIPFDITLERLQCLFKHKDVPEYCFRCGFADFLENLMSSSPKAA